MQKIFFSCKIQNIRGLNLKSDIFRSKEWRIRFLLCKIKLCHKNSIHGDSEYFLQYHITIWSYCGWVNHVISLYLRTCFDDVCILFSVLSWMIYLVYYFFHRMTFFGRMIFQVGYYSQRMIFLNDNLVGILICLFFGNFLDNPGVCKMFLPNCFDLDQRQK